MMKQEEQPKPRGFKEVLIDKNTKVEWYDNIVTLKQKGSFGRVASIQLTKANFNFMIEELNK